MFVFFLIIRQPPRATRTDTLFPYTTLFRSCRHFPEPNVCDASGPDGYAQSLPSRAASHDRKWHEPHPDASRQNDTPATSTEHSRQKRCAPAACESQWPPPTEWPDHCEKIPEIGRAHV